MGLEHPQICCLFGLGGKGRGGNGVGGGGLLSVEGSLGGEPGLLASEAPSDGNGGGLSLSSSLQLVCMCLVAMISLMATPGRTRSSSSYFQRPSG